MTITTPAALLLLVIALPIVATIGWPRNRFRRSRDTLSLILRSAIVIALVLAVAGVEVVQSAERLSVVFLVDRSDSMTSVSESTITNVIEDSLSAMRPDDLAGIVVFGGDAQVARSISNSRELTGLRAQTEVQTGATDLSEALKLGLFLFPDNTSKRIIVLSDGLATVGDWQSAAELAAANNVEVSYVPFARVPQPEIQVRSVDVPARLDVSQEFTLSVTIVSEQDTRATITVLSGGQIVQTLEDTEIFEGENTYPVRLRSGDSGFRSYEVRVDPLNNNDDGYTQNNALSAYSRVEGVPTVLVVDGSGSGRFSAGVDESASIVQGLQDAGLGVDVISPGALPQSVTALADYDSIMMVNVPATSMTDQQMRTVETYVRDLGGGLVVVGGPNSYGPGLYFETPLADAMPVEMEIKDQERLPELTIAYVIDRSGSMGSLSPSGVPYIDLAKEAIIRSIDFLQQTDRAGVASFDNVAYWVADMQEVRDRSRLQREIATLRPSGGTNIQNGLNLVAEAMREEPAEIKHIIMLTDGGASEADLVETTQELNQVYGVTTSVISIGGFEAQFLQNMADVGEGNYHNVEDADEIPAIFTVEAILATRTYIQEDPFTPVQSALHPIMQGISATPQLYGYVTTTPRDAAQVILRGPEPYNDPLLVAWQYGLGRSVAFTSDATSRWSRDWVAWDGFPVFWGQVVRWTITEGAASNLETRVVMENEQARIIVNARDNDGDFLNGLDLETNVLYSADSGDAQQVRLRQIAPGRYEGTFIPQGEGAYFLRVADDARDLADPTLELVQTAGWVMSYSAEYDIRPADDDTLAIIAEMTGGRDLTGSLSDAFAPTADSSDASVPIWPWLLVFAIALLPVDIAVRRLLITRSDLKRLRVWLRDRAFVRGEVEESTAERISTLRQARDRARATTISGDDEGESTASRLRNRVNRRPVEGAPRVMPTHQAGAQPHIDSTFVESTRSQSEGRTYGGERVTGDNIGSRLLKRRRQQDDDESTPDDEA